MEHEKQIKIVKGWKDQQRKAMLPKPFSEVIRVLLIEDNHGYAEIIGIMLDRSHDIRFDLKNAASLLEGLKHVVKDAIDVILLDLKLPDSRGIETFDTLYSRAQSVPIIVLTAIDNDKLALEAVKKGAQDYLVKDQVNSKSLVHAIRYAVERKRMAEMLFTAAHEWRTTFDAIGNVVCLIDYERNIIRCNKAMTELLNMPFTDIIKKNCCELIHGSRMPIKGCPFETLKKTYGREEILLQRRDRWFQISVDPLIDERKNLIGGVHIMTDISREKEIDRMKSELISNVSHELRTPLSTIKEGIALLFDGSLGGLHLEQKDMLSRVKSNVDRLSRLIDDLLDMSRIEAGKMEIEKSFVDISALIKEVISSFQNQANKKNIKFVITIMKNMLPMYIDRGRISQVMTNLISNSIKFTPAYGCITVEIRDGKKEAEISVSDTGIGIAQKNITGLFDRFSQFDREYGPGERGTGLGLPISKEIIEMHGGRIWVKSESGKGSTFIFTLPRLCLDRTIP